MVKTLLIATKNQGKIAEFKGILKNSNFKLVVLEEIGFFGLGPKETGKTFAQNALLKAKFYGQKSGLLTIADDSGLIVDALPGRLGVKSRRYAWGSDASRWQKLLDDLKAVPLPKRTARFVSLVAFFDPKKQTAIFSQGICEGKIAFQPKGKAGFGYDPVFIVNGVGKTFAQLSLKEKNQLSHRAKALKKILKKLKKYES